MPYDFDYHLKRKLSVYQISKIESGESVVISADELNKLKSRIEYLERRIVEMKGRINEG